MFKIELEISVENDAVIIKDVSEPQLEMKTKFDLLARYVEGLRIAICSCETCKNYKNDENGNYCGMDTDNVEPGYCCEDWEPK